jgi:hypothetical protein
MSEQLTVIVHEIATDGLPDMDVLVGRVAFIFDGCIVSGWPLEPDDEDRGYDDSEGVAWEGDSDVAFVTEFWGVTHWVEFPFPIARIKEASDDHQAR